MIQAALLIGHCEGDENKKWEYDLNRRVGEYAREAWADDPSLAVFAAPARSAAGGIYQRIQAAHVWGARATVEAHINFERAGQPQDYAVSFCRQGDQLGRTLSARLRRDLWPLLHGCGVARYIEVSLPSSKWGHYAAVEDSLCSAVLIEPAFISNPDHADFFDSVNYKNYAVTLANSIRAFAQEAHRYDYRT